MPKGNRRKANGKMGKGRTGDFEEDHSDSLSITSSVDGLSVCDESICGDQDVDESAAAELYEEKVVLALDNALDKSATTRTNSLLALCTAFSKKYVPDIVEARRATLSDTIDKCLRKGKSSEVAAAADLALLMCLQLSDVAGVELVYSELKHTLATLAVDNSVPPAARAKCCLALASICYLGNSEPDEVHEQLQQLETVWAGSCLRGDGSVPSVAAELLPLHTAAVQAWCLLATDVTHSGLLKLAYSQLGRLEGLLESPDVDLRIAAGEAIATLYERIWETDAEFVGDEFDRLCGTLRQLATDSAKSRTKRDRKQQRGTFRQILRTFEEDEYPSEQVKFGAETLVIDSWCKRRLYELVTSALKSGTNVHLRHNELVRAVLALGAPMVVAGAALPKQSKLDRMYALHEATKFRQQVRGKYRDKRTAIFD